MNTPQIMIGPVGVIWFLLLGSTASSEILINEIFYNAPNDLETLEFVELHNPSDEAVDLSGWSFDKGINFKFSGGSTIRGRGYLVLCKDKRLFQSTYGKEIEVHGTFDGSLSNKGERLRLVDNREKTVDSVKYGDSDPWPIGADGYGGSLERRTSLGNSTSVHNWAVSPLATNTEKPMGTPGATNANHVDHLGPEIGNIAVEPKAPRPGQAISVSAQVSDAVEAVLLYRIASSNLESDEHSVSMMPIKSDGMRTTYTAEIPKQEDRRLVRFRVKATDQSGHATVHPPVHALRPAYSVFVRNASKPTTVPQALLITINKPKPIEEPKRSGLRLFQPRRPRYGQFGDPRPEPAPRGGSAFIYISPDQKRHQTFDFVNVVPRSGGYKVKFHKDRPLILDFKADSKKTVRTANLLFENNPRFVLAEPMAYTVYQRAGVPSPLWDHLRLEFDGRPLGYHLLVEQPNKSFLRRHGRDSGGNLYKILWYKRGLVGQHEKKTNSTMGHEDLIEIVSSLRKLEGDAEWNLIQERFNVDVFASYFAVNMCLSNWDGFFNNYFTYHDTEDTQKWEIYPWDEDKTWGFHDGTRRGDVFYNMPLSFGANPIGDKAPDNSFGGFGFGFGRGPNGVWQRPPGAFSGPLLANPAFRKLFLKRLDQILKTIYNEETMFPIIDEMQERLRPEVAFRAMHFGRGIDSNERFDEDCESLRIHLKKRRAFIYEQEEMKALADK